MVLGGRKWMVMFCRSANRLLKHPMDQRNCPKVAGYVCFFVAEVECISSPICQSGASVCLPIGEVLAGAGRCPCKLRHCEESEWLMDVVRKKQTSEPSSANEELHSDV